MGRDSNLIKVSGFLDLHVHLREPGFEYKEDIESASRAALAGGFTTVLAMPNTSPVNDCAEVTKFILDRARLVASGVKILPVGAETKGLLGKEIADFRGMKSAGVVAVSDDGNCVQDDNVMLKVFEAAVKEDLLVISHPEDFSLSGNGVVNNGAVAKKLALPGIPREAENRIIARDIALAMETGARLHIAHISTEEGIGLVRRAKAKGVNVTCEVTPHHLLLTEEDVIKLGALAKMKPPLRTEKDRLALIAGINDGTVDAIATDHAPHTDAEKKDVRSAAFGVIGMETAFPVCMNLVHEGRIKFERLIELFTKGPAQVLGLDPSFDTASVIIDPDAEYTIAARKFHSKARNTPFDGWEVKGKIICTMIGGKVVSSL